MFELLPLSVWVGAAAAGVLVLISLGIVVIGEQESGLVVRRYGRELPAGRLIALEGEAGYQARMLSPGWHFPLWRWKYKVQTVPLIEVGPGQIALVVAKDGAAIPSERVLAKEVDCDDFQDAERFLMNGGEKGRQLGVLTTGKYRINPSLFDVVTAGRASFFGLSADQLAVLRVPSDRVGIVTILDGRPIPQGDLAGAIVTGHGS